MFKPFVTLLLVTRLLREKCISNQRQSPATHHSRTIRFTYVSFSAFCLLCRKDSESPNWHSDRSRSRSSISSIRSSISGSDRHGCDEDGVGGDEDGGSGDKDGVGGDEDGGSGDKDGVGGDEDRGSGPPS